VSGGLPDGGVHEDGGVDAHDVLMEQHHALPPIFLDVVFQFHTILAVVIDSGQTVVNITAGEDEAIFLAMAHYLLEYIFLCHIFLYIIGYHGGISTHVLILRCKGSKISLHRQMCATIF
jgi:hypothetical protein